MWRRYAEAVSGACSATFGLAVVALLGLGPAREGATIEVGSNGVPTSNTTSFGQTPLDLIPIAVLILVSVCGLSALLHSIRPAIFPAAWGVLCGATVMLLLLVVVTFPEWLLLIPSLVAAVAAVGFGAVPAEGRDIGRTPPR